MYTTLPGGPCPEQSIGMSSSRHVTIRMQRGIVILANRTARGVFLRSIRCPFFLETILKCFVVLPRDRVWAGEMERAAL
jgi:hypothetical protein